MRFYCAFALLNCLAIREIFLDAVFLWIVPLAAACFNFFSAKESLSAATLRSFSAMALLKSLMISLRWVLTLLLIAVLLAMTLIRFSADFMFAIFFHPTFTEYSRVKYSGIK